MKGIAVIFFLIPLFIYSAFILKSKASNEAIMDSPEQVIGAWSLMAENGEVVPHYLVKIISMNNFVYTEYDYENKNMYGTAGGSYTLSGSVYEQTIEFDTWNSTRIGRVEEYENELHDDIWIISGRRSGRKIIQKWTRIDKGSNDDAPLAGAWRIRDREQQGQLVTMQQGPRKTIKMLSATRFQWIAYNNETREFFGTGGGTYELNEGKYTEHIRFFSRNSTNVGTELTFDYELIEGDWHHRGLSSRGNPIYEIWEQQ